MNTASHTPVVRQMQVIPMAGRDGMRLNLSGVHGPFFTRNLVVITDSAGHTGVGEVPGGEKIRQTLEDARALIEGQPIGKYSALLNAIRQRFADDEQLRGQRRRRAGPLQLGARARDRRQLSGRSRLNRALRSAALTHSADLARVSIAPMRERRPRRDWACPKSSASINRPIAATARLQRGWRSLRHVEKVNSP
jgi:hypothetical protein